MPSGSPSSQHGSSKNSRSSSLVRKNSPPPTGNTDSSASASALHVPQATATGSRNIILCFDGTGNKFGKHNSNVVRFFQALKKQESETQKVYYQPGIGTYLKKRFFLKTLSRIASKLDEAIAINLSGHVKDGYTFLMRTYRPGDRIHLFGFSRGAYTARALAGMIYKVGLLPSHNDQQVDFAFTIYSTSNREGAALGSQFKRMFSIPVKIDFLGVWDTVSSVGIVPRSLPYSSQNDGVKVFRHALALDECRARFRPNIWGEPAAFREELDDDPDIPQRGTISRDEWVYQPPTLTDVKEVWFAGCHADIGGGSHGDEVDISLSHITLRWMVRECFLVKTGIRFDEDLLDDLGLSLHELESNPQDVKTHDISGADPTAPSNQDGVQLPTQDLLDIPAKIYNQLFEQKWWWILEILPMLSTYQKVDGSWFRYRIRNFGRGRYLPYAGNEVKVHGSVRARMGKDPRYTPAAYNWNQIKELEMVNWVT